MHKYSLASSFGLIVTVLVCPVAVFSLQNGFASYGSAFYNSLVSTVTVRTKTLEAQDRTLLDLMDPLLQGYHILVDAFDKTYLFDEQWIAPVNLGNDLMNHDARLVDLAAEPRLLCPADGICTIELLHHIVTRCAKFN